MDYSNKTVKEMIDTMATKIEENLDWDGSLYDLHNFLCNEDYYTIGTFEATQEVEAFGTFKALDLISEHFEHFGQTFTKYNDSEKVCNLLFYIVGRDLIEQCESYTENIDNPVNDCIMEWIASELRAIK